MSDGRKMLIKSRMNALTPPAKSRNPLPVVLCKSERSNAMVANSREVVIPRT